MNAESSTLFSRRLPCQAQGNQELHFPDVVLCENGCWPSDGAQIESAIVFTKVCNNFTSVAFAIITKLPPAS